FVLICEHNLSCSDQKNNHTDKRCTKQQKNSFTFLPSVPSIYTDQSASLLLVQTQTQHKLRFQDKRIPENKPLALVMHFSALCYTFRLSHICRSFRRD